MTLLSVALSRMRRGVPVYDVDLRECASLVAIGDVWEGVHRHCLSHDVAARVELYMPWNQDPGTPESARWIGWMSVAETLLEMEGL